MKNLLFKRKYTGTVKVARHAHDIMCSSRQLYGQDNESGGILIGRMILDSQDVVIDEATLPDKRDRASRFRFFRSKTPANQIIARHWKQSKGTSVYLGEWHTHPEDRPTPSCVDLCNWRRIAKKSTIEQDYVIFIIVGKIEIGIWELSISSMELCKLEST